MNQLSDALHIPDTQSERDERHLVIQRVGVKDVRYPLQLRLGQDAQPTVGTWTLDVLLPPLSMPDLSPATLSMLLPSALAGKTDALLVATVLDGRPNTAMPPWRGLLTEAEAAWIVAQLRAGLPE